MPAGRPTIFTEIALQKLNEAFAIGASDKEACFYADVSPSALYNYQERNPKFVERKEALKERPVLLARQTVVKALENDSDLAFKYLERKSRKEFATRVEQEQFGEVKHTYEELDDDKLDAAIKARQDRATETA